METPKNCYDLLDILTSLKKTPKITLNNSLSKTGLIFYAVVSPSTQFSFCKEINGRGSFWKSDRRLLSKKFSFSTSQLRNSGPKKSLFM